MVMNGLVSCSQWEVSVCTHKGCNFFLWEGGWGEGFFVFSVSPNVFPSCSHGVPIKSSQKVSRFSKLPQIHSWDVPNSTSDLSCMVCPERLLYKLKRWTLGEQIHFYFASWVQTGASIEACPMFQNFWQRANQYGSLKNKTKSCEHTHELIKLFILWMYPFTTSMMLI
jgi:hypothetical protein